MSSLSASLNKYKSELADTAARNTRPAVTAPARTSTPKPASKPSGTEKRSHDAAFAAGTSTPAAAVFQGETSFGKNVWAAKEYLKSKNFQPVPFEQIISYLSLPVDERQSIPLLAKFLQQSEQIEYIPAAQSPDNKDSYRYTPFYPVTNADELRSFLATFDTAAGVVVQKLKDGWPDCQAGIDKLEREGHVLVMRHKKDNTPRYVWPDSPSFHIGATGKGKSNAAGSEAKGRVDDDFQEFWRKTKLPANENDIRTELERAGLTPTSAVKEVNKVEHKKKERKRAMRRGGKTTNTHMMGILKEYPGKRG